MVERNGHPRLLEAIGRRGPTDVVLTNSRGNAWTADGLTHQMVDASTAAGVVDTVIGWSEAKVERMIDRYVKKDELLLDRIRRLENTDGTESAKLAAKP